MCDACQSWSHPGNNALDEAAGSAHAPQRAGSLHGRGPHRPRMRVTCGLWRGQAEASAAQMDLVLELFESPDEVVGNLEYATDLFARATMDRMAGHLQVGSLHQALGQLLCMPSRIFGAAVRPGVTPRTALWM